MAIPYSATWATGQLVEPASAVRDTVNLHGANVGAYLSYARGGWFLNGGAGERGRHQRRHLVI